MTRERTEILDDLINFDSNISSLTKELSVFFFFFEQPFLVIGSDNVVKVLDKLSEGEITRKDIEDWANAIECREDVDFESEPVKEIIHELANPLISEDLTTDKIGAFRNELLRS